MKPTRDIQILGVAALFAIASLAAFAHTGGGVLAQSLLGAAVLLAAVSLFYTKP